MVLKYKPCVTIFTLLCFVFSQTILLAQQKNERQGQTDKNKASADEKGKILPAEKGKEQKDEKGRSQQPVKGKAPQPAEQMKPADQKEKKTTITSEPKKSAVISTEKGEKEAPPVPGKPQQQKEKTEGKGEVIPLKEPGEDAYKDLVSFKSNFEKDYKCLKLPPNTKINIDFEAAPLEDITKFIACILEQNFIIPGQAKSGRQITIMSPNPVTVYEAYKAFLSALDVNGLTVVPSGKFLKIIESNKAKSDSVPIFQPGTVVPEEDRVITKIIRLSNIDIKDIEPVLQKFKSPIGDITSYVPTNTLILTDTATNVKKLLSFVTALDIPTGKEKLWVRPVEYASANEIAQTLMNVFGDKKGGGGPVTAGRTAPVGREGGASPGTPAQAGEEGMGEGVVKVSKILADERTNLLIILATPTAYVKLDKLIRKLDVPIEGEGQIHIYYLENADAEEVASTLSSLASGKSSGKSKGKPPAKSGPGAVAAGGAGAATLFEGEVKVTANKQTNSLVIESSLKDYMSIKRVIQQLDVRRKQVYVEAIIMEISSNKERKFGISGSGGTMMNIGGDDVPLLFGMGGLGISGLDLQQMSKGGMVVGMQGPLLDVSTGTTGDVSTAGSLALPTYGFLIQAIQSNSDVNILSTPHILTMDNEEAEIVVGKQIPYQAQSYGGLSSLSSLQGLTGTTGQQSSSSTLAALAAYGGLGGYGYGGMGGYVQRIDVDLTLKITPQISESNYVKLKIEQSVEDVESMDATLGPTTSKRKVNNTVIVKDQQPVVIGGLIRDTETEAVAKVPFLGDIPIFGILFRKTVKRIEKRNLLMVIIPYIIEDPTDLKRVHEKKMEEMKKFAEYMATKQKEAAGDVDFRKKHGLLEEMNKVITKTKKENELMEQIKQQDIDEIGPIETHDIDYDPYEKLKGEKAEPKEILPEKIEKKSEIKEEKQEIKEDTKKNKEINEMMKDYKDKKNDSKGDPGAKLIFGEEI